MVKGVFLFLVILLFAGPGFTQEKGINFEHPSNWKELGEKAKRENKYIFVDCYTTWCGPCKRMNKEIFPVQEVGEYMNKYFISVKVQMDITSQDDGHIKDWYDEAAMIAKKYEVNAYPTFLFFNPEGELVYKITTSFSHPQAFISTAQIAIEPNKGVSALIKKYNEGNRDTTLLKYLALAARNQKYYDLSKRISEEYVSEVLKLCGKKNNSIYRHLADEVENAGNDSLAQQLANKYINGLKNIFTKDKIAFIVRYTQHLSDRGFKLFVQHSTKINSIMGEASYNYAVDAAKNIIIKYDENFLSLKKSTEAKPNWENIQSKLRTKYSSLIAEKAIGFYKRVYYKERQLWPDYIKSLIHYINKYPLSITITGYNEFAWEVFAHSDNLEELKTALEWSKSTLTKNDKVLHEYMDTYANLLYKLGRRDEAIFWEDRALGLADLQSKELYQDILGKMKRGEKTWPPHN